jgi:hypothetical protein
MVMVTGAVALVAFVATTESAEKDFRQNKYPQCLPEGDGANSKQGRQQIVPKQHDDTSKDKYSCGYRNRDENGSFNPKARGSLFSTTFHDFSILKF